MECHGGANIMVNETREPFQLHADEKEKEIFYTEGTAALKAARIWIAKYSIPKAKERLERARSNRDHGPMRSHHRC